MPQAQFIAAGHSVDFIAAGDVAAGSVLVQDKLVGITKRAIRAGQRGAIAVEGVFDVIKDPSTNIDAGTPLYWSEVSYHVVKTASSHPLLGVALEDAPPGTTTVRVRLQQ